MEEKGELIIEEQNDDNTNLKEKGDIVIEEENQIDNQIPNKKDEEDNENENNLEVQGDIVVEDNDDLDKFVVEDNKKEKENEDKKKEEEKKKIQDKLKKKKEKMKEFKKYTRMNVPFYGEDHEGVYDLNIPFGYFDIKIKNEVDKQENYFNLQRLKLTINY